MNDNTDVQDAASPCCGAPVKRNPFGYHCTDCGQPLYERSPYADL